MNPIYHISLSGTTSSNGLRYTRIELELKKDVDLFQMFENGIRGGINCFFRKRCIESDDIHKILYVDQNKLYGHFRSQHLPTGKFQNYENNSITESFIVKVLNNHDFCNIGYVVVLDLIYPDDIKEKSKIFPFCQENEANNPKSFTEYMFLNHVDLLIKQFVIRPIKNIISFII